MKMLFRSMLIMLIGALALVLPSCSSTVSSTEVTALIKNVQALNSVLANVDFDDSSSWGASTKAAWTAAKPVFQSLKDLGILPDTIDKAKTQLDAAVTLELMTQSEEDMFLKAYAYFLDITSSEALARAKLKIK